MLVHKKKFTTPERKEKKITNIFQHNHLFTALNSVMNIESINQNSQNFIKKIGNNNKSSFIYNIYYIKRWEKGIRWKEYFFCLFSVLKVSTFLKLFSWQSMSGEKFLCTKKI